MIHWIRDAMSAAKAVRAVRKSGNTAKLALVEEQELLENRQWLAKRDYENQLMQQTIIGTTRYIPICESCEDHEECKREQKDKRGCAEWWLRWLTEEEEAACIERANTPGAVRERGEEPHGEQEPERPEG